MEYIIPSIPGHHTRRIAKNMFIGFTLVINLYTITNSKFVENRKINASGSYRNRPLCVVDVLAILRRMLNYVYIPIKTPQYYIYIYQHIGIFERSRVLGCTYYYKVLTYNRVNYTFDSHIQFNLL